MYRASLFAFWMAGCCVLAAAGFLFLAERSVGSLFAAIFFALGGLVWCVVLYLLSRRL